MEGWKQGGNFEVNLGSKEVFFFKSGVSILLDGMCAL